MFVLQRNGRRGSSTHRGDGCVLCFPIFIMFAYPLQWLYLPHVVKYTYFPGRAGLRDCRREGHGDRL